VGRPPPPPPPPPALWSKSPRSISCFCLHTSVQDMRPQTGGCDRRVDYQSWGNGIVVPSVIVNPPLAWTFFSVIAGPRLAKQNGGIQRAWLLSSYSRLSVATVKQQSQEAFARDTAYEKKSNRWSNFINAITIHRWRTWLHAGCRVERDQIKG